jgi:hypothetical protein
MYDLWCIYIYKGKVNSSSLAYNRRDTRDKGPLGRDPDRSWCKLHTRVKLFGRSPRIWKIMTERFLPHINGQEVSKEVDTLK